MRLEDSNDHNIFITSNSRKKQNRIAREKERKNIFKKNAIKTMK